MNCREAGCDSIAATNFHCAKCHFTFGSLAAFDAHQDVSYKRRDPANRVRCIHPETLGFVRGDLGIWRTPEGAQKAALLSARLATARSRKHHLPEGVRV